MPEIGQQPSATGEATMSVVPSGRKRGGKSDMIELRQVDLRRTFESYSVTGARRARML
jgi:hypothetical protein